MFQYAGYFYHGQSGLDLTMFRAYDPNLGRWISRDPIEEAGGLNIYAYVGGNPINAFDPLGLCDQKAYAKCMKDAADRRQYAINEAWNAFKDAMDRLKVDWNPHWNFNSWTGNGLSVAGGGFAAAEAGAWGSIPVGVAWGGGAAATVGGVGLGAFAGGYAVGSFFSDVWENYKNAVFNLEMIRDSKISDAEIQYGRDVRKCKKKACCN